MLSTSDRRAEVGTPDHCGGMVSVSALQRLQVTPRIKMSSHKVHTAKIFSPSGYSVSFDAKAQNVISIDRRELDKEIARQAQKAGAVVRIKTKYVERTQDGIRTGSEEIACKEFVDARGIGPLAKSNPSGIIPCCQCEVHADWIESRTVEVHMDAVKYPGFFAWVIPSGKGHGKIGVAGIKIDPIAAMERFLREKGTHSVIRRIISPVWIGRNFTILGISQNKVEAHCHIKLTNTEFIPCLKFHAFCHQELHLLLWLHPLHPIVLRW